MQITHSPCIVPSTGSSRPRKNYPISSKSCIQSNIRGCPAVSAITILCARAKVSPLCAMRGCEGKWLSRGKSTHPLWSGNNIIALTLFYLKICHIYFDHRTLKIKMLRWDTGGMIYDLMSLTTWAFFFYTQRQAMQLQRQLQEMLTSLSAVEGPTFPPRIS